MHIQHMQQIQQIKKEVLIMKFSQSRLSRWSVVPLLGLTALAGTLGVAHASPPPNLGPQSPAAQPTPPPPPLNQIQRLSGLQPNTPQQIPFNSLGPVYVWTDSASYPVGHVVQYCVQVTNPGQVTITDYPPGGQSQVVQSYYEANPGVPHCFTGYVSDPTGDETLTVQEFSPSGSSFDSTTFQTYDY